MLEAVEMRNRRQTVMNRAEGTAREQQGAVLTGQSPTGDAD